MTDSRADTSIPPPTACCPRHQPIYNRDCSDCQQYYREQIGWGRDEPTHGRRAASSESAEEMTARLMKQYQEGESADVEPVRSLLSSMVSGAWLDAQDFPPLEWLVEGVLPEGFGVLAGPPKVGKSWMVGDIGLACAAGGYALDAIPVKQRPVLYLALEDGHRRVQSRFRTLTDGQPIPAGIHVIISARPNEVPGMIAEFLELYRADKPLIILDTLGKVKPPKQAGQESYAADYAIGSRLKELVDSVPGSCLLAVHHTRKAESADFIDAVSGTQGIAGSADFILVLTRRRKDDAAILSVTGRDVVENEYALVIDDGRWRLDGMDLMDAAATVDKRRESQGLGDRTMDILQHVMTHGPTTPGDIAKAFGMSNKDASKYLSRLYESERIAKTGRGIYDRSSTPVESVESVERSA